MVSAIKKLFENRGKPADTPRIARDSFTTIAVLDESGRAVFSDGSTGINYDDLPDAIEFLRVAELAREHNAAVSRDHAKAASKQRTSKKKKGESLDYNDA